jgi:hypothetical protein
MNIKLYIKNVYGNERIYPACSKGKILAEFKGTKTFSRQDLKRFKDLGYELELVARDIESFFKSKDDDIKLWRA